MKEVVRTIGEQPGFETSDGIKFSDETLAIDHESKLILAEIQPKTRIKATSVPLNKKFYITEDEKEFDDYFLASQWQQELDRNKSKKQWSKWIKNDQNKNRWAKFSSVRNEISLKKALDGIESHVPFDRWGGKLEPHVRDISRFLFVEHTFNERYGSYDKHYCFYSTIEEVQDAVKEFQEYGSHEYNHNGYFRVFDLDVEDFDFNQPLKIEITDVKIGETK